MTAEMPVYNGWHLMFTGWKNAHLGDDGDVVYSPGYTAQWVGWERRDSIPYASYPGGEGWRKRDPDKPMEAFDIAPREGQTEISDPKSPEAKQAELEALGRIKRVIDSNVAPEVPNAHV